MIKSSSPPSPLTHPTNPPPPNQHQHSHQQAMPHIWTQRNDLTPSTDLLPHVWEDCHDGVRSFFCAWQGCKHPVGFETKTRLITHIRSVHLHEKPFVCITWYVIFSILFSFSFLFTKIDMKMTLKMLQPGDIYAQTRRQSTFRDYDSWEAIQV